MASKVVFQQNYAIHGGDYVNAGEPSCKIRIILKNIGVDAEIIRRVAIAAYEAEMNVVMYAEHGTMYLTVAPTEILLTVEDKGQGIDDVDLAMQPGYSTATEEMREMGFGAGMGLPNIRKNADVFRISSIVGQGTKLELKFNLNDKQD